MSVITLYYATACKMQQTINSTARSRQNYHPVTGYSWQCIRPSG